MLELEMLGDVKEQRHVFMSSVLQRYLSVASEALEELYRQTG